MTPEDTATVHAIVQATVKESCRRTVTACRDAFVMTHSLAGSPQEAAKLYLSFLEKLAKGDAS